MRNPRDCTACGTRIGENAQLRIQNALLMNALLTIRAGLERKTDDGHVVGFRDDYGALYNAWNAADNALSSA
jgi:hypothetical protein